jgi:two-component system sensor histidine kinase RpfC
MLTPQMADWLAPCRWVVGRLRDRPDSEHEMSVNRLVFAAIIVLVLLARYGSSYDGLGSMALYVTLALGVLGHILWRPGTSQIRRLFALLLDCVFLSWQLHVGGEDGALFFPIYLWVIFGNAFRFGIKYLMAAVPVATVSFAIMAAVTPFWCRQPHLTIGLAIGLIILPAYSGTLIRKLSTATRLAEEASAAKSLFLASVSHELRTPLTAIVGMTGLLRAGALDHQQREMTETIDVATRSLQALINGLLDLSRIEAGRMPTQAEEFDLLTLLADVRRMVEVQLRAKKLRFDLHVTPRTPLHLVASRQHLHEILLNLAGNAVKFTEAGGIVIAVDAVQDDTAPGLTLLVEVSDTGIGIAPASQARIFEDFTQADASILNRFGGTGLGLAITKRLIGLLGGAIEVQSAPGVGSTFRFHIPAMAGTEDWRDMPPRARIVARDDSFAGAMRTRLAEFGVSASVQHFWRGAPDGAAEGEVLLVHAPDWADAAPYLTNPAPPVILIDEAGDAALPELDRRKGCVAQLTDLSAPLGLRRALAIALRLGTNLAAPAAPAPTPAAAVAAAAPAASIRRCVLLVDDNRVNQRVISRILETGGHQVLVAENGEQALDLLESEADRLDLVLMDFNMPEMDGLEATKLFRMMSTGATRLPILGLTADAAAQTDARWRQADMDGCLIKPIDPPALLEAVNTMARATSQISRAAVTGLHEHPRFRPALLPALDEQIIDNLRQLGDSIFIDELMADFMADAQIMIETLTAAAAQGDAPTFRTQAHALRSSAANLGAVALGELCTPWVGLRGSELQARAKEFAVRAAAELGRTGEAAAALRTGRRVHNL